MSTDEIFFDGIKYVSAVTAAQESNLTRDYIARLCREGKIKAKRLGKIWYVEHPSLQSFFLEHQYALEKQRHALAEQRAREYQRSVNNTKPSFENPLSLTKQAQARNTVSRSPVRERASDSITEKASINAREQMARVLVSKSAAVPTGLGDAALRLATHTSGLLISPSLELLHKLTALVVALSLTLGTYAMVDTKFARYASETLKNAVTAVSDPSRVISLGKRLNSQLAAAALDPAGTFLGAMSRLARSLNEHVDRFVYSAAFPDSEWQTQNYFSGVISHYFAGSNARGVVTVRIDPYAPLNAPRSGASATAPGSSTGESADFVAWPAATTGGPTTIINNPVVERVVETQRLLAVGGISEEILNMRLQQLDNKLTSQIFSLSAANSTVTAQNYQVTAQTNKIDQLYNTRINNPTIAGGSLTDVSISASSLSVSGATALGTLTAGSTTLANLTASSATVTGNVGIGGNLSLTSTTSAFSATNAAFTNATTTNATSTNFFATYASTTNATSTNFFSVLGHFTTGVIDTLTSALATITNLTATELVATNATTTNATTTALYVSGLAQLTSVAAGTTTLTNLAVTNTSTSTFAGGLTFGTSQFVLQQATGRIGIGTTSPASIFDIYGTDALRLPVGNTAQRPSQAGIGQVRFNMTTHQFEGYGDNSVWQGLGGVIDADQDTYVTADTNNADEDTLRLITFGSERMTITSAGNVGVGTTSPFAKFAIHANNGETNSLLFEIASSTASATTSLFKIDNKGNGYFSGGLGIGVATTTAGVLQTSGNAWVGGNLTVVGNSATFGASSADTLTINSAITSNLIPDQNITRDLGSTAFYWKNAYVGTLTANNISAASTTIGGTQSSTFTLNSDNATADTEDISLVFFRGTVVPHAIIAWNSTLDRFELNQSAYISNQSGSTTQPTLVLKGASGQTANILEVASSSGTTAFSVVYDGSVTIATSAITALTAGTTTITNLSVTNTSTSNFAGGLQTGTLNVTGLSNLANILLTNATTTNFFSTTASSTNLFSTNANLGVLTAGTLSLTAGTTTNFFSTTASSTNLFSQLATLGTLAVGGNATVGGTLTVSGLCVTGDTKLRRRRRRKDGSYDYDEPEIVDIKDGDEIQSLDEKTGKLVWSRVKQLAFMGVKQTYKLTTASGKTIRTTANHPYLARKGRGATMKAPAGKGDMGPAHSNSGVGGKLREMDVHQPSRLVAAGPASDPARGNV